MELRERTEAHVRIYFEKTRDAEIQRTLPGSVKTIGDALRMFAASQQPDAASYGRTIYQDGEYVGDIWCYCIDPEERPNGMISYCIFRKDLWGKGICTEAVAAFVEIIRKCYPIKTVGAFAFADHVPSIRVLEKNGFRVLETFQEDGRESVYLEK